MSQRKRIALENFLNTTASDQYYLQSLDSYLFNAYRIPKGADKVRFFIQTVDIDGNNIPYTYYGQTIMGLVLFINPTSISTNLAKIINRTQTMTSWVEDHWGEELDTITFTGSSAAFIWGGPAENQPVQGPLQKSPEEIREIFNNYMDLPDLGTNEPIGLGDTSGLTVKRRRNTLSYDEFRKLVFLMNANGANYNTYGFVRKRLYIQLAYDQGLYRGYFESMDITETADNPYRFIYTITFKSEKTIHTHLG